jgi:CheY-like chemotaxis protein
VPLESLSEKHPLRVLVAEDNTSNQRVLLEMLKKVGYRADAVADGKEVLQAMERQPYDLILMDIEMLIMAGLKSARIIRDRYPQGPNAMAITAYALAGCKENCISPSMDDYIGKPMQIKELSEVLKKRLLVQNKHESAF